MPYFAALLLFFAVLSGPPARAKTSSGDCVDCGAKESKAGSFKTNSIESVLDHLGGIPPALPQKVQTAALYGGHKIEEMKAGYPWNGIGRLFPNARSGTDFCTAVRVSACHVMSAGHCARDANGSYEKQITYVPPFEKKAYFVDKVLAGEGNFLQDRSLDWAVMRLEDSASGNRDGWMGIADTKGGALVGKTFVLSGYHLDLSPNAKFAYVDDQAKAIKTNKGIFSGNANHVFLRANAGRGGSGGPVFRLDDSGQAWLVCLANAGVSVEGQGTTAVLGADETEHLTQCAASNAFFAKVQQFMAENPCKP